MQIFYFLLIIVLAFFVAFQPALNAVLAKIIDSNVWATIISFTIGALVLTFYALITQQSFPMKKISNVPPYLFIGGILGAVFVLSVVILFPKVGAVNLVIFTVMGQMVCSLIIDHYGWFNTPINEINIQKIAALLLMLIAIFWFQKSRF